MAVSPRIELDARFRDALAVLHEQERVIASLSAIDPAERSSRFDLMRVQGELQDRHVEVNIIREIARVNRLRIADVSEEYLAARL